ncbi:MAG TPA: DUF2336 domain-containing protein [Afipia sp.]
MQNAGSSIFDELDTALANGSPDQRVTMLRRVTDLFLVDADRYNEEQIGVFDNVLSHLIERVEARALAQISKSLAPVANSPLDTTLRLARHEEIAVAGPMLTKSTRLTTEHLVDIAQSQGQQHLLAISHRETIEADVTDVLLNRGNRTVVHRVASNSGAQISENGFRLLVQAAERDEALAEKTGFRLDIPLQLLKELLLKATDAVRSRLMPRTPPDLRDELKEALSSAAAQINRETSKDRNYDNALRMAKLLHERGELIDATVRSFAIEREYENVVASLSVLCSLAIGMIKPLMDSPRDEGLIIACKGVGLTFPTVQAIVECRFPAGTLKTEVIDKLETDFAKLSRPSAERLLRFWRVRQIG